MDFLIGITGESLLDVWSIVHLAFWIFAGSTMWAIGMTRSGALVIGILVAEVWEVFEHFMAPRFPLVWKDPESWWNAWISDPIMCVIGILGIWWLLSHRKRRSGVL